MWLLSKYRIHANEKIADDYKVIHNIYLMKYRYDRNEITLGFMLYENKF